MFELAKVAKEKMEPSAETGPATVNASMSSPSSAQTSTEHSWTCIDLLPSAVPSSQAQVKSLGSTQDNAKQGQGSAVQTPSAQQQKSNVLQQDNKPIMIQFGQGKAIPTYLDEFRNGFPADGLSSVSVKWWGNAGKDDTDEIVVEEDNLKCEVPNESSATDELEKPKDGKYPTGRVPCDAVSCSTEPKTDLEGVTLLSSIRKRSAEDGSEVLNLGITRGYSASRLTKREKWLLSQVFGSSLPSEWRLSMS